MFAETVSVKKPKMQDCGVSGNSLRIPAAGGQPPAHSCSAVTQRMVFEPVYSEGRLDLYQRLASVLSDVTSCGKVVCWGVGLRSQPTIQLLKWYKYRKLISMQ
jgi:hypothetical protein